MESIKERELTGMGFDFDWTGLDWTGQDRIERKRAKEGH